MPENNDIQFTPPGIDFVPLLKRLYEAATGGDGNIFIERLESAWEAYSVIAILFSLLFFIGFVYAKIRANQLGEIEAAQLAAAEAEWQELHGAAAARMPRWVKIQEHIASVNPNDWRLAIIEADVLLDETLRNAGYAGATIGDMLKSASPTSFQSLEDAWEAHKIRNQIAHAGSDFVLTSRTAHEAIIRYERVFREFGVI